MSKSLVVVSEEWPHGLRCVDCGEKLTNGSAYTKRLVGISDDGPPIDADPVMTIVEIVCVMCGLREALGGIR